MGTGKTGIGEASNRIGTTARNGAAKKNMGQSREIALFGGSFNPLHMGHVYVMAHVLATEPVDELWLVPAHTHAFAKSLAPYDIRLRMCEEACRLFSRRVRVSTAERDIARADRPSFTIDTLSHLQEQCSDVRFGLVIGSDILATFGKWKESARIRKLARLIVIHRAGHPVEDAGPPLPDVSSTWIRQRLRRKESLHGWVPKEVARMCEETSESFNQS